MATDPFYAPGDNGRDARTIAWLCAHVVFLGSYHAIATNGWW
jgi:hypothetical protein